MDDNSQDRSEELIKELNDPRIRFVRRKPEERGLAASELQGIMEAKTDYFMTIDCDFQHPPSALGDMYKKMEEGADLCIGIREDRFALGFVRWAGSWAFNIFADLYLMCHRKKMSRDVMSGLFAGRVEVYAPVIKEHWNDMELQGWKVLIDLLKFGPRDIKIANVKYKFGKRAAGESHISPRVVVTTFNQLGCVGKFFAKVYSKLKKC